MRVPDSKRFGEMTSCRIGASSRFCTTMTAKLSPGTLIVSGRKLNCSIVTTSPKIHAGLDEGRPNSTSASTSPANPHLFRMYIGVPFIEKPSFNSNLRASALQLRETKGILRDKAEWMPLKAYKMSQKIREMGGWPGLAHGPAQPPSVVFNQRGLF